MDHLLTLKIKAAQEELDHSSRMQQRIEQVNVRIAKMEHDVALQALARAEEQHRNAFGDEQQYQQPQSMSNENPFMQGYLGSVSDAEASPVDFAEFLSTLTEPEQEQEQEQQPADQIKMEQEYMYMPHDLYYKDAVEQQQQPHPYTAADTTSSMEESRNEVASASASAVTMPTSTTGNDIGVHVQSTVKQLQQESTIEVNNNDHEQQLQQEDISTEVQIAAWKQDPAAIEAREQEIKREQEIDKAKSAAMAAVQAAKKKEEEKEVVARTAATPKAMDPDVLAKEVGSFSSVGRGVFFGIGAGTGLIVKDMLLNKGGSAATVLEVVPAITSTATSSQLPISPELEIEPVTIVEAEESSLATPVEEVEKEIEVVKEEVFVPEEQPAPVMLSAAAQESIMRNFPHAIPLEQFNADLYNSLANRGYNKDNAVFASSIAPSQSIFAYDMMDSWGLSTRNHYFLGGLAGVPFMGITGLRDFLSNLPAAGNVVTVLGTHVNVDQDGTVGLKTAGGSLQALLNVYRDHLRSEMSNFASSQSAQENYIMSTLEMKLSEFPPPPNTDALAQMTNLMFFIIKDFLQKQVVVMEQSDPAWNGASEVSLVGGVIVNTPDGVSNQFHPMSFEIWDGCCGTNV